MERSHWGRRSRGLIAFHLATRGAAALALFTRNWPIVSIGTSYFGVRGPTCTGVLSGGVLEYIIQGLVTRFFPRSSGPSCMWEQPRTREAKRPEDTKRIRNMNELSNFVLDESLNRNFKLHLSHVSLRSKISVRCGETKLVRQTFALCLFSSG